MPSEVMPTAEHSASNASVPPVTSANSLPHTPKLPAPPHHAERHHAGLYFISWKLRTSLLYGKEHSTFSSSSELI